ncbi:hypothetical protein EON67_04505 [archaeon]|nr:MAG: hypothetical protein EON67_04505 [archaeon]
MQLEMMFETFQTPAAYIARAPALAAFSMGRGTAVVVDIGASSTRVTPVYDGYVLQSTRHAAATRGHQHGLPHAHAYRCHAHAALCLCACRIVVFVGSGWQLFI